MKHQVKYTYREVHERSLRIVQRPERLPEGYY